MPTYRANALANFLGQLISGLLTVALIPLYLRLMGAAGYGVVALMLSIQTSLALLDLGLSAATNRELARSRVPGSGGRPGDFYVSVERIYWVIGLGMGGGLAAGAPVLLDLANIDDANLDALRSFGLLFALRWPVIFYVAVLRGLELQVQANVVSTGHALARALVTIIAVYQTPTPLAFILAQVACSLVEVFHLRLSIRQPIQQLQPGPADFDWTQIREVWGFSVTATATTLAATLVKQADKFLVAHFAGPVALAYYYAAAEAGRAIQLFSIPLTNAAYPRFSVLFAQSNPEALKLFFLRVSHLTSFLIAGAVGLVAGLAGPVLWYWSRDPQLVAAGTLPFALLAIGYGLNAMMHLPYSLQLATGQNRINMWFLFGYLLVGLPITYFVIRSWGGVGGAAMWLFFNLSYVLIVPPLMDRRLNFRFAGTWLAGNTRPFLVAAATGTALSVAGPSQESIFSTTLLAATYAAVYLGVAYTWFLDRSLLTDMGQLIAARK